MGGALLNKCLDAMGPTKGGRTALVAAHPILQSKERLVRTWWVTTSILRFDPSEDWPNDLKCSVKDKAYWDTVGFSSKLRASGPLRDRRAAVMQQGETTTPSVVVAKVAGITVATPESRIGCPSVGLAKHIGMKKR